MLVYQLATKRSGVTMSLLQIQYFGRGELAWLRKDDPETVDELAVRNVRAQIKNVEVVLGRLGKLSKVQVKGYIYNVKNGKLEPVPPLI